MIRRFRLALTAAAATLAIAGVAPLLADGEPLDERASYSWVRTLEGRASLASSTRAPGETVGANEPLLRGDQVRVERGARLEIVLADRNLLRVGGGTSLRLTRVAFSADGDDRTTRLDLDDGEIVLDVTEQALGDELPELKTAAGTVYIHQPGRYRLTVDGAGSLAVTVRDGYAELLTERGSTVVRSGEEAWTRGDRWGSVELNAAGPRGALELWADDLERGVQRASRRELRVEPYLAYSASRLDDYGSWIYVDASWYWRPRVSYGWRPYWDGRWAWTPSGLTWVSHEPWGWVPYHYGSWTVVPGYGWVWRPGHRYSPAWVYWYVGPTWTGWCPIGYYTHYYRRYWDTGFRFGIYGWSGGSWGFYADWNFLPSTRIFVHDGGAWRRTGTYLGRNEPRGVPPGILTTDTREVPREHWQRPDDVVRTLERRAGPRGGAGGNLPEVTDFVARRPALPRDVERAVVRDPSTRGTGRRSDSPLDPGVTAQGPGERRSEVAEWRRRGGGESPRTAEGRGAPGRDAAADDRLRGGFGRGSGDDVTARGADERRFDGGPASTPERGWNGADRAGESRRGNVAPEPTTGVRRDTPAADDRQGWRRPSDSGSGWRPSPGTSAGNDAPVTRVIGGVRRSPGSDRAPAGPPSSGAAERDRRSGPTWTPPASGADTGRTPRTSTPPAGWRGTAPGSSRGSAPSVTPRQSPPPTPQATPQTTTPPAGWRGTAPGSTRGSAPSVTPRQSPRPTPQATPSSPPPGRGAAATARGNSGSSRGGSSASASNRGSSSSASNRGASSSGNRAQASSSGGSKPSQSSSSPPPRRQRPQHDDD